MGMASAYTSMSHLDSFGTAGDLVVAGQTYWIKRLKGLAPETLPYSIRILLENLLRAEDGVRVTREQIESVVDWGPATANRVAIDLSPTRIFLHDTNGVPLLVDLAAMRHAMRAMGGNPSAVNPFLPSDLVVDHSVIADVFGTPEALKRNEEIEYERNAERYRFLQWGQSTLARFHVIPPGKGIMHQVNLEYLARVVESKAGWAYPDLCLGTDSHTTMVNGLGVLGWGIGGIDAEAAMLGEGYNMLLPSVVGFRLTGALPAGSTATDLVLTITELLREKGVVGSFVEFHGEGVGRISVPDRATIANMSPEFGSTCTYFPIDEQTLRYLHLTARQPEKIALVEAYAKEQGLWHRPHSTIIYTDEMELDLRTVRPSLAGPRRPQDRVPLDRAQSMFRAELASSPTNGSTEATGSVKVVLDDVCHELSSGAVAIAAITSCTNTSNPTVMVAAALLARNAVQRGLTSKPWVKTTLSPGSRVVTEYLDSAGLTTYLDQLGFYLVGFGCMTCIGASGPLIPEVQDAVRNDDLLVVSVLSGNRNFQGRINPDVRMNYLASPPLVVAYALAGTMDIDLLSEPLGFAPDGTPVLLEDLWPSFEEVADIVGSTIDPAMFASAYSHVFEGDARWRSLAVSPRETFEWDEASDYLRLPPYFEGMRAEPDALSDIHDARVLVYLGDSVTTDHISPAGAIPTASPAGIYLAERGVERSQFNTYASRRGNHEVMMRGTFANGHLRNRLLPGVEGGLTPNMLERNETLSVYDAAAQYREAGVPLVVLGGAQYGAGSSRDWGAKGPALLGVRAILAESFERIHRSNLIGVGILPLEYLPGDSADAFGLSGYETFDILGLTDPDATEVTVRAGSTEFRVIVRLDTAREREIYRHGGLMKLVLRRLHADQEVGLQALTAHDD